MSPKSREQTPELKRILTRIKEKKRQKEELKDKEFKKDKRFELMSEKKENKTNSVSAIRKVFESNQEIDKSVIKCTEIPTMQRLNKDSPLPKLGTPRRGSTKKGTPKRKGRRNECVIDKNQLRLIDFWEKKSRKVPEDDDFMTR